MKYYTDWCLDVDRECLPPLIRGNFWLGCVKFISDGSHRNPWMWRIFGVESGYSSSNALAKRNVEEKLKRLGYRYADERVRKALAML